MEKTRLTLVVGGYLERNIRRHQWPKGKEKPGENNCRSPPAHFDASDELNVIFPSHRPINGPTCRFLIYADSCGESLPFFRSADEIQQIRRLS